MTRKRWIVAALTVSVLAVGGAGAAYFEPWTLWTRSTLEEAAPTVSAPAPTDATVDEVSEPVEPVEPVVLTRGEFVTQEHGTSGLAKVIELPDGSRVLRFEGFSTSNGPDLHVWLSEETAGGDWFKYDEVRSIQLGGLKATDGSFNYTLPADADLDGIQSVVIWCKRFHVAFGSAPLDFT